MTIRADATPYVLSYGPAALGFTWGGAWFYVSAFSWWDAVLPTWPEKLHVERPMLSWEPLYAPRSMP